MRELRRTRAGPFTEETGATSLHELSAAQEEYEKGNETSLRKIIKPMEEALHSMPQIIVRDSAVDSLCHGATLAMPGIAKVESTVEKNKPVALLTLKGEAIALGQSLMSFSDIVEQDKGLAVRSERVLMARKTYPSMWK